MATIDRQQLEEWLHLDLDDELSPNQRRELERQLAVKPELVRERDELTRLDSLLAAERVEVRPDFASQVMAELPVAPWEARSRQAWKLPLAVLVVLLIGGGLLATISPSVPGGSLVVSMAEMVGTALITGAGLLGASWTGLRLAFVELVSTSPTGVVGLVVALVALNFLLVSLLRRRRRAPASDRASSSR
ncbi:MAG: hypothetical protein AAGD01_07230 [Acidobacteriota bacterium]